MLHPDGQYEPQLIPAMCAPILAGEADFVLGSRFAEPGMALAPGDAALEVRGQPGPDHDREPDYGNRAKRGPHRLPRLLAPLPAHRPVPPQRQRLQLRLGDLDAGGRLRDARSSRCAAKGRYFEDASSVGVGAGAVYGLKTLDRRARAWRCTEPASCARANSGPSACGVAPGEHFPQGPVLEHHQRLLDQRSRRAAASGSAIRNVSARTVPRSWLRHRPRRGRR